MYRPSFPLKKGDLIAIIAPAKAIEEEFVFHAMAFFKDAGYRVMIGRNTLGNYHYFSGTDQQRREDFQQAIDNPEVKAILCARGGYGAVRIVDGIKWNYFQEHPKWIIGYSDITVFHQQIQRMGMKSIHATMPLNFMENTPESLQTLLDAIEGKSYKIQINSATENKYGKTTGVLIGGNLSVLCSLIGTNGQADYTKKILFIEEVDEQLYAIDRMFFTLKKAGVWQQIEGLIVGGMTNCKDTTTKTIGMNIQEMVLQHVGYRNIPVCFDFPAGHIDDNRALVMGEKIQIEINQKDTTVIFPGE